MLFLNANNYLTVLDGKFFYAAHIRECLEILSKMLFLTGNFVIPDIHTKSEVLLSALSYLIL